MPKFFINPPVASGEGSKKPNENENRQGDQKSVVINGEDANHLARVLRAKPGEEITATDGQGRLYKIVLTAALILYHYEALDALEPSLSTLSRKGR